MHYLLYKLEKSAMQSGLAKTTTWVLKPILQKKVFTQYTPMQWASTLSTEKHKVLTFPSKESAIEYCQRNGATYQEYSVNKRAVKPKSYAENFQ